MLNDGTGTLPSVGATEAPVLLGWLLRHTGARSIIDLGTGVGWLVRAAEMAGVPCLGVEGNALCAERKVCSSELLVADVTADDFEPGRFDLATAFETVEHIPLDYMARFFAGASRVSDRLICSIHYCNQENDAHQTIRPAMWWDDWFSQHGIVARPVTDFPIARFDMSLFYDLDLRGMDARRI